MSSGSFFVKPNASFEVVIPFSIQDPESPQLLFADKGIEDYPATLKAVPEEHLSYEWMRFRKPNYGMDCFVRELAYDGNSTRERVTSQDKLDELRLKYFLIDSSLFPQDQKVSFTKEGQNDILSGPSLELIKSLEPFILRMFLGVAARIWDLGLPIKHLLTQDDYKMLRNNPNGAEAVTIAKGLKALDEADKKKSTSKLDSEKPAGQNPKAATATG